MHHGVFLENPAPRNSTRNNDCTLRSALPIGPILHHCLLNHRPFPACLPVLIPPLEQDLPIVTTAHPNPQALHHTTARLTQNPPPNLPALAINLLEPQRRPSPTIASSPKLRPALQQPLQHTLLPHKIHTHGPKPGHRSERGPEAGRGGVADGAALLSRLIGGERAGDAGAEGGEMQGLDLREGDGGLEGWVREGAEVWRYRSARSSICA